MLLCTPSPTGKMRWPPGAPRWVSCCSAWRLHVARRRWPCQYAQAPLAADAYTYVVAAIARTPAWTGALRLDPECQVVATPRGGTLTLGDTVALVPGEVLVRREGDPPFTLAVATRDAEPSPTIAPIAAAARQALVGETLGVLPAFV